MAPEKRSLRALDQFEFHHALEAVRGNSLVCFTAPRCGACKAMRRALIQLEEVQRCLCLPPGEAP